MSRGHITFSPPLPLLFPVRLIPGTVHAGILAVIFNHLLRGQALVARLRELEGKCVSLRITDVPCEIAWRFHNGRLHAAASREAGVIIAGRMASFLELACRRQDPDTLFFTRELSIEGDTEAGVHVKNLLDALEFDWEGHLDAVLPPPLAACGKRLLHLARRVMTA